MMQVRRKIALKLKRWGPVFLLSFAVFEGNAAEIDIKGKAPSLENKALDSFLASPQEMRTQEVLLRILDKTTARISEVSVPLGKPVKFGNLEITARFCQKSLPEDPPESTAFLEIAEHKSGEASRFVFKGWMFASSPSVSAMEHAVYDVWIKECQGELLKAPLEEKSALSLPSPPSSSSDALESFKRGFSSSPSP